MYWQKQMFVYSVFVNDSNHVTKFGLPHRQHISLIRFYGWYLKFLISGSMALVGTF